MPDAYTTLTGLFTAVADALRARTGSAAAIPAQSFPSAIAALPSGGTDTSDATAAAADILLGKTAYANGVKLTGTVPSLAAATVTPGAAAQTIAAGQYLAGAQTVAGDANLVAGNIRSGVSIFGVAGALESFAPEPVYAENITYGYVNSSNWNYYLNCNRFTDVYRVRAGRRYLLGMGVPAGNRFVAAVFASDVTAATASTGGTAVGPSPSGVSAYDTKYIFTAAADGTLAVTKSYNDADGSLAKTWLLDLTDLV